jgi:hypothetical protein|tara:strand:- start:408 stop:584 length:177 start_codon:yes stop_codon:yes gene_type:complete
MLEIKKIETGRKENGKIVIVNTQWSVFQCGREWSRHDTEAEAITEMAWMNGDDYRMSI